MDGVVLIGVGRMGGAVAERLLGQGVALAVGDADGAAVERVVALGAHRLAELPAAAWRDATVLVCVPGPPQIREVVLGAGGIVERGVCRGVVNLSTVGVAAAQETGAALAAAGIPALEAPVSGGPRAALEGRLSLMVSGSLSLWAEVEPLLALVAARRFYVGEAIAAGQAMKLVNNLLAATALAITAEGVVLGEQAGLDLQTMLDVLNASSGRNSATVDKLPVAVVPRTYDYGFTVDLVEKDVALAVDAAAALGVPLRVGAAVLELWRALSAAGGGAADYTTIVPYLEGLAGFELPALDHVPADSQETR